MFYRNTGELPIKIGTNVSLSTTGGSWSSGLELISPRERQVAARASASPTLITEIYLREMLSSSVPPLLSPLEGWGVIYLEDRCESSGETQFWSWLELRTTSSPSSLLPDTNPCLHLLAVSGHLGDHHNNNCFVLSITPALSTHCQPGTNTNIRSDFSSPWWKNKM